MRFEDLPQWRKDNYKDGIVRLWTRAFLFLFLLIGAAYSLSGHDAYIKNFIFIFNGAGVANDLLSIFLVSFSLMMYIHTMIKAWIWLNLKFIDSAE